MATAAVSEIYGTRYTIEGLGNRVLPVLIFLINHQSSGPKRKGSGVVIGHSQGALRRVSGFQEGIVPSRREKTRTSRARGRLA